MAKDQVQNFINKVANYKATFNTPQGKAVLDDLIKTSQMMTDMVDIQALQVREGRCQMLRHILRHLEKTDAQMAQIVAQAKGRREDANN